MEGEVRERGREGTGGRERAKQEIIDILTRDYTTSVPYRGGVEDVRQKEVEQCPELVEVVLERGASQEETVGRTELSNNLRELGEGRREGEG